MKQLRIGVHYEPSNIDPHLGAAELALQMTNGCLDPLLHKTVDGHYLPGLARSYEVSDDQCTYTFHLRDDVSFHDGTPFDAAAMKISLDRARDPANRSQLAGSLLGSYREARVVDAHCLEITLTKPYALFLDALSQSWLAPMSPKAIAEMGEGIRRHPVGTGPFIFDRWEAGDCLVIPRNPAYAWGPEQVENKGAPLLDEIVFRFLPDDAARSAALLAGEVDAIYATNPGDCAALRADGRFDVATNPIRGVPVSLMMNIKRAPTDSIGVRRAISHALDIDALVAEVFHGEFERAHSPVSQFTLGFEPATRGMYPHDLDRAAALLEAEGWIPGADGIRERDGARLSVVFYALPVNFYPEFGAIVTRQLARAGIEVTVELCAPPAWIAAGMNGDHNLIPQGKYASTSQLTAFVYHSSQSGPNAYGWSKRSAGDYPEIDEIIDAAETALAPEDYVPLFKRLQMAVMEAALAAPLHCNTNLVVSRREITGLAYDAIGAYPLFNDTDMPSRED